MEKIPKFNKHRAFNKAVGPGKKSKINNHRDYRVTGMGKEKIHEQMS